MPRIRKLQPSEIRQLEAEERATVRAEKAAALLADETQIDEPRQGRFIRTTPPIVGDIVELRGKQRGIILQIRRARDGSWDYAEVLADGERRWVRAESVGTVLGRPTGISRIDHPRKRTYGWYVRAYAGSATRVSRFFSDMKYGGRAAALSAALTYHQAAIEDDFTTT